MCVVNFQPRLISHILDVVSVDSRPGREAASQARVSSLIQSWQNQVTKEADVEGELPSSAAPATLHLYTNDDGTKLPVTKKFTSMRVALPVVLQRMALNLFRQREAFFNRLIQAPLLAGVGSCPFSLIPMPLKQRFQIEMCHFSSFSSCSIPDSAEVLRVLRIESVSRPKTSTPSRSSACSTGSPSFPKRESTLR